MALRNAVQLITYPDRLGRNLGELYQLLDRHLGDALGGVHILPLYPSNADGGFSPLTHMEVDPRYGDWADVERISGSGIIETETRNALCSKIRGQHPPKLAGA